MAEPRTQGQEGRVVFRNAFSTVVCALVLATLVTSAHADDTKTPTSGTSANASETDARLTRLAHKLADDQAEPDARTSLASAAESVESSDASDTIDEPATKGTPIVNERTNLARTPLLRGGADSETLAERADGKSWLMQTLIALGIVVGLALGVRFIYARMGGKVAAHSSPVVEVLSRTTVAPHSHVMLLRVGSRVLVVSDSSAGMRTLANVDDAEEVADILGAVSATKNNSITRGFSQLLHRFGEEHEDDEVAALTGEQPASVHKVRDSMSSLLSRVRSMGREGGGPG